MRAFDIGDGTLPVRFRGDVERDVDAGTPGKVAGNRGAAGVLDRRHNGATNGAGSAGTRTILPVRSDMVAILAAGDRVRAHYLQGVRNA